VYFEPGEVRFDDPVMNGDCPRCGRGLPGKPRAAIEAWGAGKGPLLPVPTILPRV